MPNRRDLIVEQALSGLFSYYECLGDSTFYKELAQSVTVPDTGNDQLDYEAVRDSIEKICNGVK